LAVLVLACVACHEDRMCSAIGAEPGVNFDLKEVLTKRPLDVKVCVDSTCVHRRASVGRGSSIFVEDQALNAPTMVPVTVVISRPGADRPVMEKSTNVQLSKVQPNGPDCPPLVYQAAVDVRSDGIYELHGPVI